MHMYTVSDYEWTVRGSRHTRTSKTLTIAGQMIMDRPVANALVLLCMCCACVAVHVSPLYVYGDGWDTDFGDVATKKGYTLTSHNVWGTTVSKLQVSCRPSD